MKAIRTLVVIFIAVLALGAAATATPDEHPAYLHALSDLRDARAHLERPNGGALQHQEQDAIHEFQQAIAADPSDRRAMSSWYKLALIYRNTDAQQSQTAMQKFLQIRAQVQQRQAGHTAPMIHKRTDLPVADPEKTQAAEAPGNG